jgi:L-lactate dehydrogenase (cytochrome)
MPIITNIEDLRRIARRKIPRAIYDYVERGSYDELTLNANRNDLDAIRLRQRVLIDVSTVSLKSSMLGEEVSMPVAIAPTGLTGLVHGDGEMLAARAAEAAGTRFCLSTMSICSIEDVRGVVKQPFWFQLYMFRDRGFSKSVIERARNAGCSALFVTVDLPMRGQRHADIKNGLTVPPRLTVRNAFDIATKPAWLAKVLLGKRKTFGNVAPYLEGRAGLEQAGACSTSRTPRPPHRRGSTASSYPITAAASSTARIPPSRRCPRSRARSATASRCCSTAASVPGRMCSRRSAVARTAA